MSNNTSVPEAFVIYWAVRCKFTYNGMHNYVDQNDLDFQVSGINVLLQCVPRIMNTFCISSGFDVVRCRSLTPTCFGVSWLALTLTDMHVPEPGRQPWRIGAMNPKWALTLPIQTSKQNTERNRSIIWYFDEGNQWWSASENVRTIHITITLIK